MPRRRKTVTIEKKSGKTRLRFSRLLSQEIESKGFQSAKIEILEVYTPLSLLKLKIEFFRDERGRKIRKEGEESWYFFITCPNDMIPTTILESPLFLRIGEASWLFWNSLCCWFPAPLKEIEIKTKQYIGFAFLRNLSGFGRQLYFSGNLFDLLNKFKGLELVGHGERENTLLFVPKKECFFTCRECPNPRCFPLHKKRKSKQKYIFVSSFFPKDSAHLQGRVFKCREWLLGVEF